MNQRILPPIFVSTVFNLMVRVTGVEPARDNPPEPKSGAFASSAIPAYILQDLFNINLQSIFLLIQKEIKMKTARKLLARFWNNLI